MNSISQVDEKIKSPNLIHDEIAPPTRIRIGVSKKPVARESKGAHFQIEHRTIEIDELVNFIQNGHALGAICAGKHVYENFIARQDIQVDIDTNGDFGDNPLPYFQTMPFVARHAFLIYRTKTAGHCRIVFRLSKQISNPVEYKRYAHALVQELKGDQAATSPVQLWYTYAGCDVAIVGRTMPVGTLKALADRYSDLPGYEAPAIEASPEELLQQACEGVDGRNVAGYNLALSLRRLNMPEETAKHYMERFQRAVTTRGDHPYTWSEAEDSLKSAYRNRKVGDSQFVQQMKDAIILGDLPANLRQTADAVLSLMEKFGRTVNVELSLRLILEERKQRADRNRVHVHLKVLNELGILRTFKNGRGRLVHTLLAHFLTREKETQHTGNESAEIALCNPNPVGCVSFSRVRNTYSELHDSCAIETNAKIHPQMISSEEDYTVRLGSGSHVIIAYLEGAEGNTVDSFGTLAEACNLSWRLIHSNVESLAKLGVVEICKTHRKKGVTLCPAWRDKLRSIEPLLTTYGRDILRGEKMLNQQVAYHEHIATNARNADIRVEHEAMAERAEAKKKSFTFQKLAAMEERRVAAQNAGLNPETVPNISLFGDRRKKVVRQPVVAIENGKPVTRAIIPNAGERVATLDKETGKYVLQGGAATGRNSWTNREWLARMGYIKVEQVVDRIQLGDCTGETERITVQKTVKNPMISNSGFYPRVGAAQQASSTGMRDGSAAPC